MDGVKALNQLSDLTSQVKAGVKRLQKSGVELAEAEAVYKSALTEEVIRLKNEGLAATLIDKVAQGSIPVVTHKKNKDIAEVNYKACQESLYNLRLEIRVLEAEIKMECIANE